MDYREFDPVLPLRPHIECLWTLDDDGAALGEDDGAAPGRAEKILPDGCMELIFNHGRPFRRRRSGLEAAPQPRSFLIGELDRFVTVEPSSDVGVFAVRFRPGGLFPFLPALATDLVGRTLEPEALWGRAGRDLERSVVDASTAAGRQHALESFLLTRLPVSASDELLVAAAVRRLEQSGGSLSIDALARDVATSFRTLERRFRERVGLTPKRLARVIRFQRTFQRLEQVAAGGWADVALACGYFDQAHFIRDFRTFAGETPAAFLTIDHPITDCFTGRHD